MILNKVLLKNLEFEIETWIDTDLNVLIGVGHLLQREGGVCPLHCPKWRTQGRVDGRIEKRKTETDKSRR